MNSPNPDTTTDTTPEPMPPIKPRQVLEAKLYDALAEYDLATGNCTEYLRMERDATRVDSLRVYDIRVTA